MRKTHSIMSSLKSDNQALTLLTLALITTCLVANTSASVSSNGANDYQLLADEKSQPQANSIFDRIHLSVTPNDLQPGSQPEAESGRTTRLRAPQDQQHSVPPASQPRHRSLMNQGVINGNHATYVEPPADFKPIIYDFERQLIGDQAQKADATANQAQQQYFTMPSENFETSNQLTPTSLPQQQPSSTDQIMISRSDYAVSYSDSNARRTPMLRAERQNKVPSLGELEAGNDEPKVARAQVVDTVGTQYWPASSDAELKPSIERWSGWHDMSIEPDLASSDSSSANFYTVSGGQFVQPMLANPRPVRYAEPADYGEGTKGGFILAGQRPSEAPVNLFRTEYQSIAVVPNPYAFGQKQQALVSEPQNQFKSGQQANGQNSATGPISGTKGTKLPLNLSQQINFKQQDVATGSKHASRSQQQNKGEQAHTSASRPPASRRLKRRRKSKTNAEVRIRQLVAASERQADMLNTTNKQVNGLTANQLPATKFQQLTKESSVQDLETHQQQRVSQLTSNQPTVVVKRVGSHPAAGHASATNSSATPAQATPTVRRVIKRRRVKTLLPVGLTSWFLGGIRDLDGRHWHLPADVANRLAVNDVDFVSHTPVQPRAPSSGGSVVMLGESSPLPAGSDKPRQTIPR